MARGDAVVHLLPDRRSWAWQIPLGGDATSIGIVAPCEAFHGTRVRRDLLFTRLTGGNHAFGRVVRKAERSTAWRVVGDHGYRLRRRYGKGWLLVGDASGFIDPIFASGVDIAMYSAVFAYESILPLLILGRWTSADEEFSFAKYERRIREGTAVWSQGVNLFYEARFRLRGLAGDQSSLPAICRFLQGNPYELQNEQLARSLFDRVRPPA